ncbi:hydroxyisourate hydrolase [Vibrio sp. PP-XX7]
MGYLTTHILDTTQGIAAAGVIIKLYEHTADGQRQLRHNTRSNADGRCDHPSCQRRSLLRACMNLSLRSETTSPAKASNSPPPVFSTPW